MLEAMKEAANWMRAELNGRLPVEELANLEAAILRAERGRFVADGQIILRDGWPIFKIARHGLADFPRIDKEDFEANLAFVVNALNVAVNKPVRTDAQIVAETNALARICLSHLSTGYEAPAGHKFYEAEDPRSRSAWQRACEIMEHMTATDPNDALSNLDEEPGTQTPPPAWVAHTGLDYTVVMRLNESTDNASIQVYGDDAPALAERIAAALSRDI